MPRFNHDCDKCHYLGEDGPLPGEPKCNAVDLYICTIGHKDQRYYSLIRRYSSEDSEYGSLSVGVVRDNNIDRYAANLRLAKEQGFIQ